MSDPSVKYLVAWPRNGLGDRLKSSSSCWAAAEEMGRRFALRWVPPIGCDAHWNQIFRPNLASFLGDYDRCYEGQDREELINSDRLKRYKLKQANELKDSDHKWIEVCSCYYCSDWNTKEKVRPYLKRLVRPKEDIHQRVKIIISNFTKNTIGVHIRKTFGGTLEKCYPFVEEFLGSHSDPKIFFCSDTTEYYYKFAEKYGDLVVSQRPVVRNRSIMGIREAITDFCSLSRCNAIVGTKNSSFSEMATILSDVEDYEWI